MVCSQILYLLNKIVSQNNLSAGLNMKWKNEKQPIFLENRYFLTPYCNSCPFSENNPLFAHPGPIGVTPLAFSQALLTDVFQPRVCLIPPHPPCITYTLICKCVARFVFLQWHVYKVKIRPTLKHILHTPIYTSCPICLHIQINGKIWNVIAPSVTRWQSENSSYTEAHFAYANLYVAPDMSPHSDKGKI